MDISTEVLNVLPDVSAWRFGFEFPLGPVAVTIAACISVVLFRKIISFVTGL